MSDALKIIIETMIKEFVEKLYEHFKNESKNDQAPQEPSL